MGQTLEQKAGIENTLIWIFGIIALILGLFLYNFLSPGGLSEERLRQLGYYGFKPTREISNFELVNHKGETVTLEQLKGNWSLIFFGFTSCPEFCPTTLGVLNRAMEEVRQKPQIIMVSVDPEFDTVAQLAHYVPSFNKEFVGYTGDFEQIATLATELNVAFGRVPGREPETYTVDHSISIALVDAQGRYAGIIKAPHQAQKISQILDSVMR
jgi:protein SCO1/2